MVSFKWRRAHPISYYEGTTENVSWFHLRKILGHSIEVYIKQKGGQVATKWSY